MAKAAVCKTVIHRFESGCRLQEKRAGPQGRLFFYFSSALYKISIVLPAILLPRLDQFDTYAIRGFKVGDSDTRQEIIGLH